MDTHAVAQYAKLVRRIKKREADLKKLKAARDDMQADLLDEFLDDGVSQIRLPDGLVYLRTQMWAGPAPNSEGVVSDTEKRAMIKALKRAGPAWRSLVAETVNTQRLSAAVRERPRDKQGMPILPPTLAKAMKIKDRTELAVRKS